MQKYDIFLIDADGTLFDYDMAESYALKAMFDSCGFGYSEAVLLKYRDINSQVWAFYEQGGISREDMFISRFLRLFESVGVQCDDARGFNEKYLVELGKGIFLIDGALEICKEIVRAGKQIFIVTNGAQTTQQSRIRNSLISEYITDFFVSECVGHQKPKVEFFDYVFAHIPKTPKEKILVVGDSLSADIAGGNNAGIDSCWFNADGRVNDIDIMPTYEICRLNELSKFI